MTQHLKTLATQLWGSELRLQQPQNKMGILQIINSDSSWSRHSLLASTLALRTHLHIHTHIYLHAHTLTQTHIPNNNRKVFKKKLSIKKKITSLLPASPNKTLYVATPSPVSHNKIYIPGILLTTLKSKRAWNHKRLFKICENTGNSISDIGQHRTVIAENRKTITETYHSRLPTTR